MKWSVGSYFFEGDNFRGIFNDIHSMMFTQFLMKELAHILIRVRKIFSCRVSFKILLLICLKIVENELWT